MNLNYVDTGTSHSKKIFDLPESWTGNFQIRGCIIKDDCVEECEDCDAEFFGIFAQDADGLHIWVEDCDTRSQADDLVKYLKTTI
ncbi:hypothetical protein ACFQDN_22190 [Pseudomonas asuensis]|uniref:Uncharacterized protein n=1 Tax=Pseudomonas asuensis TaxID=1825787 RepID=A0ABQ2H2I0_9PSED|nr:hypothetical protein [Pseudomonas asuensis]GGM25922.1 hypothetical protein GCM10009425_40800 [Pseudomonas asuensis]